MKSFIKITQSISAQFVNPAHRFDFCAALEPFKIFLANLSFIIDLPTYDKYGHHRTDES